TGAASDEPLDLSCPVIRQNDKGGAGPTADSRGSYGTLSDTAFGNKEVCCLRRGRAPTRSRDVAVCMNSTTGPSGLMKRCNSFESGANSLTSLKHLEEVIHSLSDIRSVLPASRVSAAGVSRLSAKGAICQDTTRMQSDSVELSLGSHPTALSMPSKMAPNAFPLPFIPPTLFSNPLLSPRPTFNLFDGLGFLKNSGTDSRTQNNLPQDFGGILSPNFGFSKDSSLSAMFSHLMMVNR
ncbi:unnamed protein product, partial [Dibothriocephalus latus]